MKTFKPYLQLLFVLLFLFILNKILYRDLSEPNVEFIPEMVHSTAYDSFAPNPNFSDGKTLQNMSAGTIPRGFLPEHSDEIVTELNSGSILINPLKPEKRELSRGETVYRNFCSVCHGQSGMGDGSVIKKGVPPPPSLKTTKVANMKDGQIYFIITNGRGNMASYKSQLSGSDRWRVILFIRTMGE